MGTVKFIICTVVSFVFLFVLDFVWYSVIWNAGPEGMEPKMEWMVVGYLIFSLAFCYMYPKGVESSNPTTEGLRFGVLVALLAMVSQAFMWLAMPDMLVEPESLGTTIMNSAFHIVQIGTLGVVVAFLSGASDKSDDRAGPGGRTDEKDAPPPPPDSVQSKGN